MLTHNKLVRRPDTFKAFTGLNVEEFDKLYKDVERKYPEYEFKRLYRDDRKNAIGQGRKLYVAYCFLGYLFNLGQSNVWRNIKYLEPVVKACIPFTGEN